MVPPYFTQLCCALTTLTPCFTNTPTSLSEYLLQDYLPAASALSSTSRKLSLPENLWYSFFSNAFYFSIINKSLAVFNLFFSFAGSFNTAHRHLLLIIGSRSCFLPVKALDRHVVTGSVKEHPVYDKTRNLRQHSCRVFPRAKWG